jgi:alkyl hydroperoxide reductase subunit AhpC
VIIAFHPGAFTNVCSAEILDLELRKDELSAEGAQTVTISADAPASKAAWGKAIGAKETPLLADFWPHGEVAKQYGVFNEKLGMAERATFIVDEDGKVIWKKVYDMHDVPDLEEVKGALRS